MIVHNFQSGRITGAGVIERIGLELMRLSTKILAPIEFTGFSWSARIVRTLFPSDRPVRLILGEDSAFEYPYGDGYWGVLLYNKKPYAPEVEPYLKALADVPYAFIDCGSNYGYMSVVVSSAEYGSKPAIAIEADTKNHEWTARNAAINGGRFEHRHNAVYSKSGEIVSLGGAKHEARSIVDDGKPSASEDVETLALDDLTGWLNLQDEKRVVLKLDVEGVEIDALKGAGQILERGCLIIYEEHGADKTHEVSHYLKDELGMRLFLGNEDRMQMREITSYDELDALKTNPRRGYDLFATSDVFWVERMKILNF